MKKFAESLLGKIVIGVVTPLLIAFVWYVLNSFTGIYEGSQDGSEALKQNRIAHPKIDSICVVMKSKDKANDDYLMNFKMEYERQTYRDSVRQAEALQYMERLINELESK